MKIRNKKTGEVVDLLEIVRIDDISNEFYLRLSDNEGRTFKVGFNSLAELNAEWEDYEENEYYYAITSIKADGGITKMKNKYNDMTAFDKSIGNYFESKKEAEKAVEKLKAWKRLKDSGFRFNGSDDACISYRIDTAKWNDKLDNDFDLLFGGEE